MHGVFVRLDLGGPPHRNSDWYFSPSRLPRGLQREMVLRVQGDEHGDFGNVWATLKDFLRLLQHHSSATHIFT